MNKCEKPALDSDLYRGFLKFAELDFPRIAPQKRCSLLLAILKQCDPQDMRFLSAVMPRLHRDFLKLLPPDIIHRILFHIQPKDLITAAQVSKAWSRALKDQALWHKLYSRIGLAALSNTYYNAKCGFRSNARQLLIQQKWVNERLNAKTFKAHLLGITCLSFDGKRVVTTGLDKSIRVHNLNGKCLQTITGFDFVCAQADEHQIISGSADGFLRIYSLSAAVLVQSITAHTLSITCLKFDRSVLCTGSADRSLKIWQLPLGAGQSVKPRSQPGIPNLLRTLNGHKGAIKCLDFSAQILVTGDIQGSLRIWHLPSGNCLLILTVSGSGELPNFIPVHKLEDSKGLSDARIAVNYDPISCVKYTDTSLLFGTFSGRLYQYQVRPHDRGIVHQPTGSAYEALRNWATSPETFAVNRVYHTSETAADNRKTTNAVHDDSANSVHGRSWVLCCASDSWRLIGGTSDGRVCLWNHLTGTKLYTLDKGIEGDDPGGHDKAINSCAFNDSVVVAGCMDGHLRIWGCRSEI